MPASTFDKIPPEQLYIFNAPVPGSVADDLSQSEQPGVPEPFNFALMQQAPIGTKGGTVRIAELHQLQGGQDDRSRTGGGRTGRNARAALASERGRVAVLASRAAPG